MPIEERTLFQPAKALLIALGGITVAIALGLGVLFVTPRLAQTNAVEVKLGDDTFEAGSTENMSMVIRRDGAPILYPAVVGDRDIYLQHLGEDPEVGWSAFDARQPGSPRSCTLAWQPGGFFTDPCEEGVSFDAAGTGLPRYDVTIEDGMLFIDFRGLDEVEEDEG